MILGVDLNNFLVVNLLILGIKTDSNSFPILLFVEFVSPIV
jgi:hypothetical protein